MSENAKNVAGEIAFNVVVFAGTIVVLHYTPRIYKGLKHKLGR